MTPTTPVIPKRFRTDRNRNPTAFTTDIAHQGGLTEGVDYTKGDPFQVGNEIFYTAKLLGDPIALTIKVINKIGFFNGEFRPRWTYLQMEFALWTELSELQKKFVISLMYQAEGGVEMKGLFA